MEPLTNEKLGELAGKTCYVCDSTGWDYYYIDKKDFQSLIEAARRSCRRPIADAPRDGKRFDLFTPNKGRFASCVYTDKFSGELELLSEHGELIVIDVGEDALSKSTWLPVPGEGGV